MYDNHSLHDERILRYIKWRFKSLSAHTIWRYPSLSEILGMIGHDRFCKTYIFELLSKFYDRKNHLDFWISRHKPNPLSSGTTGALQLPVDRFSNLYATVSGTVPGLTEIQLSCLVCAFVNRRVQIQCVQCELRDSYNTITWWLREI